MEAYEARIRQLSALGLGAEAKVLAQLVRDRHGGHAARVEERPSGSRMDAAALAALVEPLTDPTLAPDRRAELEQTLKTRLTSPTLLARCEVLPEDHPLRVGARAVGEAFRAATSGPVHDEQIALPEISRRSPLASWKMLVRAIAFFYRGDDDACRRSIEGISLD
ncbi:MAG: hypothetical protein HY815_30180, partial [Candidatus Riflebacteria bacterium]|nr:hypothetical protein [Candidatus Riflebacteria bacterium]